MIKKFMTGVLVLFILITPAFAKPHPNPQNFTCYAGTPQEVIIYMADSPAGDLVQDISNVEWTFAVQSNDPLYLGVPTDVTLNFTHPFDFITLGHEYTITTPIINPIGAPLTPADYVTIRYEEDINGYRTADLYFDSDPLCIHDVDYVVDTEPNMLSTDFQKGAIIAGLTASLILLSLYIRNGSN